MMALAPLIEKYKRWAERRQLEQPPMHLTQAAVLVPLVLHQKGMTILLNQRTDHLKDHAGQVCFPGGRINAQDESPLHTALRETHEENGILPDHVKIIGPLKGCETITGFNITPFLCSVEPPLNLTIDPYEVKSTFELPWDYLLDPGSVRIESEVWDGITYTYPVIEYENYTIWGATASILVNVIEVARG